MFELRKVLVLQAAAKLEPEPAGWEQLRGIPAYGAGLQDIKASAEGVVRFLDQAPRLRCRHGTWRNPRTAFVQVDAAAARAAREDYEGPLRYADPHRYGRTAVHGEHKDHAEVACSLFLIVLSLFGKLKLKGVCRRRGARAHRAPVSAAERTRGARWGPGRAAGRGGGRWRGVLPRRVPTNTASTFAFESVQIIWV